MAIGLNVKKDKMEQPDDSGYLSDESEFYGTAIPNALAHVTPLTPHQVTRPQKSIWRAKLAASALQTGGRTERRILLSPKQLTLASEPRRPARPQRCTTLMKATTPVAS